MNQDRNPIVDAVEALVAGIVWPASSPNAGQTIFKVVSQRMRLPDEVDADAQMPALYIADHGETYNPQGERLPPSTTINYGLYIYTSFGRDPQTVPSRLMNTILDQIDRAFKAARDPVTEACTLGGLVSHAWVEGEVVKVPGELDGIGLAIVPVKVLVP